jgi:hypothetical protein
VGRDVALDTSWEQDVVSALLVAVATILMAVLLAAVGAQPEVVVLAVVEGLRAVPAAYLPLKAPGAAEPAPVLLLVRREDAAVPKRQVYCLGQALVFAGVEPAFPVQEALRALAAWARQQWEMLPGSVAAVALAPLAWVGAVFLAVALVGAVALSQFGRSVQMRSLTLMVLVAR